MQHQWAWYSYRPNKRNHITNRAIICCAGSRVWKARGTVEQFQLERVQSNFHVMSYTLLCGAFVFFSFFTYELLMFRMRRVLVLATWLLVGAGCAVLSRTTANMSVSLAHTRSPAIAHSMNVSVAAGCLLLLGGVACFLIRACMDYVNRK